MSKEIKAFKYIKKLIRVLNKEFGTDYVLAMRGELCDYGDDCDYRRYIRQEDASFEAVYDKQPKAPKVEPPMEGMILPVEETMKEWVDISPKIEVDEKVAKQQLIFRLLESRNTRKAEDAYLTIPERLLDVELDTYYHAGRQDYDTKGGTLKALREALSVVRCYYKGERIAFDYRHLVRLFSEYSQGGNVLLQILQKWAAESVCVECYQCRHPSTLLKISKADSVLKKPWGCPSCLRVSSYGEWYEAAIVYREEKHIS